MKDNDHCNFPFCRCSAYSVPDRSDWVAIHLAAEAATATKKIVDFLKTFIHLTVSFDGWSSKNHDEVYTIHMTTPLRHSFLVGGLVLTGLSVTGELLFERLQEVCHYLINGRLLTDQQNLLVDFIGYRDFHIHGCF